MLKSEIEEMIDDFVTYNLYIRNTKRFHVPYFWHVPYRYRSFQDKKNLHHVILTAITIESTNSFTDVHYFVRYLTVLL